MTHSNWVMDFAADEKSIVKGKYPDVYSRYDDLPQNISAPCVRKAAYNLWLEPLNDE